MKAYDLTMVFSNVSDAAPVSGLETCAGEERQCEARTIAHVAEMDRRRLFRERGYPSMHAYLVESMHLSEAAAFNRIAVGRTALRHPRVFDMIAAGELHLSGAKVLGPVLASCVDEGNVDRLLDAARHQSKRRIQELVAAEAPRPDVPTRVTQVPGTSASSQLFPEPVTDRAPPAVAPPRVEPLAPRRYALQVTISQEVHDKLRQAQDLLRHAVPDGDVAQILDRGLDLVIAQAQKRQFASFDRLRMVGGGEAPRPVAPELCGEPPDHDGAIPAHVRREVAARDGYRCTFVADHGSRCWATAWLEFDHIVPRKLGGPSTVSNVRLLCRSHNLLEAERTLGAWVTEIPARRRRRGGTSDVAATGHPRDASVPPEPETFAEAHLALVTLGYRKSEASGALAAVRDTVRGDAPLEDVIRAALGAVVIDRGRSRQPIGPRPRRDGGTCREPGPGWCARHASTGEAKRF